MLCWSFSWSFHHFLGWCWCRHRWSWNFLASDWGLLPIGCDVEWKDVSHVMMGVGFLVMCTVIVVPSLSVVVEVMTGMVWLFVIVVLLIWVL